MINGSVKINELPKEKLIEILEQIQDDCVIEAGDSYLEFGRKITKYLVSLNIIKYGL